MGNDDQNEPKKIKENKDQIKKASDISSSGYVADLSASLSKANDMQLKNVKIIHHSPIEHTFTQEPKKISSSLFNLFKFKLQKSEEKLTARNFKEQFSKETKLSNLGKNFESLTPLKSVKISDCVKSSNTKNTESSNTKNTVSSDPKKSTKSPSPIKEIDTNQIPNNGPDLIINKLKSNFNKLNDSEKEKIVKKLKNESNFRTMISLILKSKTDQITELDINSLKRKSIEIIKEKVLNQGKKLPEVSSEKFMKIEQSLDCDNVFSVIDSKELNKRSSKIEEKKPIHKSPNQHKPQIFKHRKSRKLRKSMSKFKKLKEKSKSKLINLLTKRKKIQKVLEQNLIKKIKKNCQLKGEWYKTDIRLTYKDSNLVIEPVVNCDLLYNKDYKTELEKIIENSKTKKQSKSKKSSTAKSTPTKLSLSTKKSPTKLSSTKTPTKLSSTKKSPTKLSSTKKSPTKLLLSFKKRKSKKIDDVADSAIETIEKDCKILKDLNKNIENELNKLNKCKLKLEQMNSSQKKDDTKSLNRSKHSKKKLIEIEQYTNSKINQPKESKTIVFKELTLSNIFDDETPKDKNLNNEKFELKKEITKRETILKEIKENLIKFKDKSLKMKSNKSSQEIVLKLRNNDDSEEFNETKTIKEKLEFFTQKNKINDHNKDHGKPILKFLSLQDIKTKLNNKIKLDQSIDHRSNRNEKIQKEINNSKNDSKAINNSDSINRSINVDKTKSSDSKSIMSKEDFDHY